jgi:pimeloyl-ACP methyl ester carboxylesterase
MRRTRGRLVPLLGLVLASVGCGGGADGPIAPGETIAAMAAAATAQGDLVSATFLGAISVEAIAQAMAAPDSRAPAVVPRYGVDAYRVIYMTIDAKGEPIAASGLVALPRKTAGTKSPLVSYQHGTIFRDAEAPSNAIAPGEPPIVMAALGAIVIAADYVGYGVSKGAPHPYLLSAPTAAAVADLITAVRGGLRRYGIAENGQLFLVGYSEGGYATMAAHRALESSASEHLAVLVGAAPGAGPYDMQAVLDFQLARIREKNPLIAALINPGFLRHLGSTLRAEVRRQIVRSLLPGDADVAFDTSVIDLYLDDDVDAIKRLSSVHDWRPALPVRMFHGRDDQTVPYSASTFALQAMRARAAPDVALTDCVARPVTDHLECVAPYFQYLVDLIGPVIRDR